MLSRISKVASTVPLAFTRYFVYTTSLVVTVLCVLLPLSVLTYWQFYVALVPQPTQLIALEGHTQDIDLTTTSITLDHNSDYRVNIKLRAVCSSDSKGRVLQFPYTFSVRGSSTPLYTDSFFIDCDTRYIHNAHNAFVPYNLRYWLSPWLVNHAKTTDIDLRGFLINGGEAARTMKHITLQIAGGNGDYFMIDTHVSQVAFSVVYSGFRYYLVRYFYLCLVVGLLAFWTINSLVCFLTVLFYMLRNQEDVPTKDYSQGKRIVKEEEDMEDPENPKNLHEAKEEPSIRIKQEDEDAWEDELTTKVEN